MRYYNPAGQLDSRPLSRTYGEEAKIALSSLDCALNGETALYVSSELTSGKRLFDLIESHGARSAAELEAMLGREQYLEQLFHPNVAAANAFARRIRGLFDHRVVVTPGPLMAPGWSQPEYLAFWETLIRTRIEQMFVNDHWQFSNGCTFEFAVACDAGVPVCDAAGSPLSLTDGAELIRRAIQTMRRAGQTTPKLDTNLARLEDLAAKSSAPEVAVTEVLSSSGSTSSG